MKKPYFVALTVAVFSVLYWFLPEYSEQSLLLKRVSNVLNDAMFKIRYASEPLPASRDKLLVIAIDDESSFRLGLRWPWPRSLFASMVEELTKKKAAAIGLNFTFTGLENGLEDSTRAMGEAIRAHGRVVVGSTLDGTRLLRPHELLTEAGARHGYLEKIIDDDFVIRRTYASRAGRSGSAGAASFPLVLWRASGGAEPAATPRTQETDGEPINYLLKIPDVKSLSSWKLLEGRVPEDEIRGKTVLIGITSSLLSENHQTPLGLMPGVWVHANEWVALEEERPLRPLPAQAGAFAGWLVGTALLALFLQPRVWLSALAFTLAFFLTFLAAQFLFAGDLQLPLLTLIAGPTLALMLGVGSNLLYLFLENRGLEHRVLHDKMTGLYTYDYLRMRLDDEWKRCQKLRLPVSVVMTDLDRFKKINDTLGHETGNQMILRAAGVIRESVRGYDVVSRYGGDEFVILLWHANPAEASAYRQRLRNMYETMASALEEPLLKTSSISIGIACFDPAGGFVTAKSPQQLIEAADKDLFEDKESRRKPGEDKR